VIQCHSVNIAAAKRNFHCVKLSSDVHSLGVTELKSTWHFVGSYAAQNIDSVCQVVGHIFIPVLCILYTVVLCFSVHSESSVDVFITVPVPEFVVGKQGDLGWIYLGYHMDYCQWKIHFLPQKQYRTQLNFTAPIQDVF
jgi:hypothetical protein